jgi:hypothetical protein
MAAFMFGSMIVSVLGLNLLDHRDAVKMKMSTDSYPTHHASSIECRQKVDALFVSGHRSPSAHEKAQAGCQPDLGKIRNSTVEMDERPSLRA